MRSLFFAIALALGAAAPAVAQQGLPPYPVSSGEQVRVVLAPSPTDDGAYLVGRVRSVSADSLGLATKASPTTQTLAWSHVTSVERRGENRKGEVLGLLIGGAVGGLAGYVLGPALINETLVAEVVMTPVGAFWGLLIGSAVGAHVGDRWEPVSPAQPAFGFSASLPIR